MTLCWPLGSQSFSPGLPLQEPGPFLLLIVVGMVGINMRYDKIINHAVPQDKVVQKIIRNLQSMTIDSSNMLKAVDRVTVERLQNLSSKRLRDFSSALALGGAINSTHMILDNFRKLCIRHRSLQG